MDSDSDTTIKILGFPLCLHSPVSAKTYAHIYSIVSYIYLGNVTNFTGAGEMVHYPYRDLVVQPPMPPMHSNMPASSILEKNPSQSFSIYRNPSGNSNTSHLRAISLNPFISF
jgi:hypothetical protein